jgi:hypothetical protein
LQSGQRIVIKNRPVQNASPISGIRKPSDISTDATPSENPAMSHIATAMPNLVLTLIEVVRFVSMRTTSTTLAICARYWTISFARPNRISDSRGSSQRFGN